MKHTFSILRRFLRDEHGTLTMEFLLWLPLLAFWFVVSVVFYDAYKSRNDAAKATHTLSDIMSRQVEVSDAYINDLALLEQKLLPRVSSGHKLRISSIQYANNAYTVLWSRAIGGGLPLTSAEIDPNFIPQMADFDTVIVTEVSVPFVPFADWVGIQARSWSFALVTRPRFVSQIAMIP